MAKGLKANEWCSSVQPLIKGKGGGKPESAQAVGSNVQGLQEALKTAKQFAMEKLGINELPVVKEETEK